MTMILWSCNIAAVALISLSEPHVGKHGKSAISQPHPIHAWQNVGHPYNGACSPACKFSIPYQPTNYLISFLFLSYLIRSLYSFLACYFSPISSQYTRHTHPYRKDASAIMRFTTQQVVLVAAYYAHTASATSVNAAPIDLKARALDVREALNANNIINGVETVAKDIPSAIQEGEDIWHSFTNQNSKREANPVKIGTIINGVDTAAQVIPEVIQDGEDIWHKYLGRSTEESEDVWHSFTNEKREAKGGANTAKLQGAANAAGVVGQVVDAAGNIVNGVEGIWDKLTQRDLENIIAARSPKGGANTAKLQGAANAAGVVGQVVDAAGNIVNGVEGIWDRLTQRDLEALIAARSPKGGATTAKLQGVANGANVVGQVVDAAGNIVSGVENVWDQLTQRDLEAREAKGGANTAKLQSVADGAGVVGQVVDAAGNVINGVENVWHQLTQRELAAVLAVRDLDAREAKGGATTAKLQGAANAAGVVGQVVDAAGNVVSGVENIWNQLGLRDLDLEARTPKGGANTAKLQSVANGAGVVGQVVDAAGNVISGVENVWNQLGLRDVDVKA